MNTFKPLLFLLVLLTVEALASRGGLPLDLKKYPREIRFSRHHDVARLNDPEVSDAVTFVKWREHESSFYDREGSHRIVKGGYECESILLEMQGFAIKKMSRTEYIDPSEAKFYMKLGKGIDRKRVGFYETLRVVPSHDPILKNIGADNFLTESFHLDFENTRIRSATVWSVAGQTINTQKLNVEPELLPWQLEPEWAEVSKKFDRKKYPMVWEWGRAAQDLAGDILPLYHANALANLHEILASGVSIDHGYVMFHSLAKSNTKIYEAAFPGSRYADKGNDENVLFLVPLQTVLKRYPPSAVSKKVKELKVLLPEIPDEYLVLLVRRYRALNHIEADLVNSQNQVYHRPLVLRNWSSTFIYHELKFFLAWLNVAESRFAAIRDYVFPNIESDSKALNLGQYTDRSDPFVSTALLNGTQTLEISNVPEFMRNDTDALKRLLVETFFFKLQNIASPFKLQSEEYRKIAEDLMNLGFQVAITTEDPILSATLQGMGGVEKQIQNMIVDRQPLPGEVPQGKTLPPTRIVIFPLSYIEKLSRDEPHLLDESSYYVRELQHSMEYHLKQVDQF